MKKWLLILLILSSCCERIERKEYKVVEKITTQNRDGSRIYYTLLLENGRQISVDSKEYAQSKIGDVWIVKECVSE